MDGLHNPRAFPSPAEIVNSQVERVKRDNARLARFFTPRAHLPGTTWARLEPNFQLHRDAPSG